MGVHEAPKQLYSYVGVHKGKTGLVAECQDYIQSRQNNCLRTLDQD